MNSEEITPERPSPIGFWWVARLVLIGIFLAAVIVVGWQGYQAYRHARAAWQLAQGMKPLARQLAANPTDMIALTSVAPRLASLEVEVTALRAGVAPLYPLLRRLEWLPRVGAEVAASPNLLDTGVELLAAGRIGIENGLPLLKAINDKESATAPLDRLAQALPALQASAPAWAEVGAHLDSALASLQGVDASRLTPALGDPLQTAQALLPRVRPLIDLIPQLPDILGANGERSYLIIAQNSDELRPTGGLISGVGLLRLSGGKLVGIEFTDSYAVDTTDKPHPPAPDALNRYMGIQLLYFRDANWSPDFPTSARTMQSLYKLGQGRATDGVIALDIFAAQIFVAALQPLTVAGIDIPITSENVVAQIKAAWDKPVSGTTIETNWGEWFKHRKDFMPVLLQAALERISQGDVDLARLGRSLWEATAQKHLLVYLNAQAAQNVVAAMGWDGSVSPGSQDFLAVFDANVGYNKVNAVVTRQTDYAVAWEDGHWLARLTLTYTHPVQAKLDTCIQLGYGRTYEDMTQRCYWDYVRVYIPAGSQAIQVEGLDPTTVEIGAGEGDATMIAGQFVLPPATTQAVRVTYQLPPSVIEGDTYRLRIQKEPGIGAWPLRLTFTGPAGTIWAADGQPPAISLRHEGTLDGDMTWSTQQMDIKDH
jgi:hypothetical protein